jgi:hypothetical protein
VIRIGWPQPRDRGPGCGGEQRVALAAAHNVNAATVAAIEGPDAFEDRIRVLDQAAFERGEADLVFASFPSDFCIDSGRAIINAGAPPIIGLTDEEKEKLKDADPERLATLPCGARLVYEYRKQHMKPAGFGFSARILNFPDDKPGDVGMFFTWLKSQHEM